MAATALTLAALVALAVAASLPPARTAALRAVGRALVVNEPLEPVDSGRGGRRRGRGTLVEAADIVCFGLSARVGVIDDPEGEADRELARRGIPFEDATTGSIRLLRELGVPEVERVP